jgi:esterase/lipase superfamily enzyme
MNERIDETATAASGVRAWRFMSIATACLLAIAPAFASGQEVKPTPSGSKPATASPPKATATPSPTSTASPSATATSPAPKPSAAAEAKATPVDDWAKQALKEDPLAAKSKLTVSDLQAALADPKTSDIVIERHFARADLEPAQRAAFLRAAFDHKSIAVRRQAVRELSALKLLDAAVADELLKLAASGDADTRRSVVVALRNVDLPWSKVSEAYWKAVLEALASSDEAVSAAALDQIERWGPDAVPSLLDAVKNGDPAQRKAAAPALSRVVGSAPKHADVTVAVPEGTHRTAPTMAKSAPRAEPPKHSERELDAENPEKVRVYYGTNRAVLRTTADPRYLLYGLPVIVAYLVYRMARSVRRTTREPSLWRITKTTFGSMLFLGLSAGAVLLWNAALREHLSETTGPVYGGSRAADGTVHYGYCDVTIPKTHKIGMVEKPVLGLEDEQLHVMLRHVEEMKQEAFFGHIKKELAAKDLDRRNCFIFVHGYNVSFEKAAQRTAQIHYDLKFTGVPMFYSWPSRANVRGYFHDRNEIYKGREQLMKFLLDTAERTDAKRIHVIAHSMGADAVSNAILLMGDQGKIFDQIVLAAPDVDADVFREQIAPRMQKIANRTTVYCSRNDLALHASYAFNDSVRLGDSSRGIFVLEGFDTIDASDIDTDLLGHSYYGDCNMLLADVGQLLDKNLSPLERKLSSHLNEKLSYWTFGKPPAADGGQ